MKPAHATLVLAILLAVAACDDPTGVGVELIDNGSGAPEAVELAPGLQPDHPVFDVTGGARRALMGATNDPLIGGTAASAALDFALPATVVPSVGFRTGPATSAELRLVRDYRYGDTTATVDLAVSEIFEEWTATGGTSSTTISPGPRLLTATVQATDTLLTIPLPESWVDANDSNLRSQDFVSIFRGFLIEPQSEGVVLGIDVDESHMRVISGGDTASFLVSRNLSLIERTAAGNPPAGLAILQDGPGTGLGLVLDFESADVTDVALARVVVRVPYDSIAIRQQLPPNFVRPTIVRADLVGITEDSLAIPLATSQVRNGALLFDDPILTSTLQGVLIGESVFRSFALMGSLDLAPVDNTVNTLLLRDGSVDADGPSMALTVIRPATL